MGIDPLDEPGFGKSVARSRPALTMEPHNKVVLSHENRDLVKTALLNGYPLAAIARALSITTPTLKRLIADDPDLEAQVEAQRAFEETELRDILMELARKGDTVAAIFLAKARHNWRDRDDNKLQVASPGSGVLLLPGPVPLDEWEAAAAIQQAKFRERPATERLANRPTSSAGLCGLTIERAAPDDLIGLTA